MLIHEVIYELVLNYYSTKKSMENQNCEIIVSCPGKILLVGGYAVISNEFPGWL